MTTVGYGDIAPITPLGQAIAALIMIMGYGIIAVPTGIVTLELNELIDARPIRAFVPNARLRVIRERRAFVGAVVGRYISGVARRPKRMIKGCERAG